MTEFLHEVVKKRERDMEYRTLRAPFVPSGVRLSDYGQVRIGGQGSGYHFGFRVPTLTMPPNNEIAYNYEISGSTTRHYVVFPNVGGWVQTAVSIDVPSRFRLDALNMLMASAWQLLAGHPCRPNYTWSNNSYICMGCSDVYYTHGSEWVSA